MAGPKKEKEASVKKARILSPEPLSSRLAAAYESSDNGFGKRTDFTEYLRGGEGEERKPQTRGGKGLRNYNLSEDTGLVAGILSVTGTEDVMLIADNGVIIRMPVETINVYKRDTKGVRVMRLDDGGRIIALAAVEKTEEEE